MLAARPTLVHAPRGGGALRGRPFLLPPLHCGVKCSGPSVGAAWPPHTPGSVLGLQAPGFCGQSEAASSGKAWAAVVIRGGRCTGLWLPGRGQCFASRVGWAVADAGLQVAECRDRDSHCSLGHLKCSLFETGPRKVVGCLPQQLGREGPLEMGGYRTARARASWDGASPLASLGRNSVCSDGAEMGRRWSPILGGGTERSPLTHPSLHSRPGGDETWKAAVKTVLPSGTDCIRGLARSWSRRPAATRTSRGC